MVRYVLVCLVFLAVGCGSSKQNDNNGQNSNSTTTTDSNNTTLYALNIHNVEVWCNVTASANGNQLVNFSDANATVNLPAGTTVNLTAAPLPSFGSPEWTGTTSATDPTTYVMTTAANQNVSVLCPVLVNLTIDNNQCVVNASSGGYTFASADSNGTISLQVPQGATIDLNATPETGYANAQWTGTSGASTPTTYVANSNGTVSVVCAQPTVVMTDANATCSGFSVAMGNQTSSPYTGSATFTAAVGTPFTISTSTSGATACWDSGAGQNANIAFQMGAEPNQTVAIQCVNNTVSTLSVANNIAWCYVTISVNGTALVSSDGSATVGPVSISPDTLVNLTASPKPGFFPPVWTGTSSTTDPTTYTMHACPAAQTVRVNCPD